MQNYKAPLTDMKFIIDEFLGLYFKDYSKYDISDLEMVLDQASKLCEETLLPINQSGDNEGCKYENGNVKTPYKFKEAYQNFIDNGWQGIKVSEKYGGQNLPYFMNILVDEIISSSNMSFGLYPGLTSNAIDAIEKNASEEIKNLYLPKLTSGQWSGTMNLTEPQCGTDLGLSKALAVPQKDGTYNLTGTKIFITCGEHDLTENIIHLVLARTPNAPKGIKGISLFLVPKIIPNKDGSLDIKNKLECGSIEKKMGINASPTCVMHYNEAKSWLIGDLHKGMKAMFIMMNGARLFVGVQGLGISEVSYQSALRYSKERIQGKSINNKNNDAIADPIIVHPEIRRNLLKMKSINEGLRGLLVWTGAQIDCSNNSTDINIKQTADNWTALLTPILKSFCTDMGIESANTALQVYGGHGYIRDHGMEQLVRDVRITSIYEGTNGIQALDLVTRKMLIQDGKLFKDVFDFIKKDINNIKLNKDFNQFTDTFKESFKHLEDCTKYIFVDNKNDNYEIIGPAVDYLKLFALVLIGFIWIKFIEIAYMKKDNSDKKDFYISKISTGKFYLNQILPDTYSLKSKILNSTESYNNYNDNYFELGFK